jgi:hypothetical protein
MDERGAEVETAPRSFAEGSRGICNCNSEDALLIAAAPDLAEALIRLLNDVTPPNDVWAAGSPVSEARAALIKAGL